MHRGRTRRETARLRWGTGHRMLSLMTARAGVGHILLHQAPPYDSPPLPTRPANELSTPNSFAEARADEYSVMRELVMDNKYNGLADARTLGEV